MASALEELLQKKRDAEPSKFGDIDWEVRKTVWLEQLHGLFNDIKIWLQPLEKKGLLRLFDGLERTLIEEHVGTYTVPVLEITAGGDRVRLTPVATLVIGSFGRVDMKGPKGRKMMIILSESDRPAGIRTAFFFDDQPAEIPVTQGRQESAFLSSTERMRRLCKWYFVHPADRSRIYKISEESFGDVLAGMLKP